MRRGSWHWAGAWGLTLVGLVCLVAGLALAIVLGPDSRFSTGPHRIDTTGVAVVTAPGVISWKGLRADVLVQVPVDKPVFVGLGNSVDVQSYLRRTQRLEVTDYHTPWTLRTREREGQSALPGAPTALDWWIDDSAGLGAARISTTLPDETVSLAVLAVGSTNLSGLQVSVAYGIDGGFAKGVGLALIGAAGIAAGLELRRRRLAAAGAVLTAPVVVAEVESSTEPASAEEYVYVYVDEHGVEHEVTEAEAERLAASEGVPVVETDDVSDVVVEVPPDPTPDPDATPDLGPIGEDDHPGAGDAGDAGDDVVYVWVDDDGVEHEISADELHEFEPYEDDEQSGDGR